jgi:gliding motility-associated-like protein
VCLIFANQVTAQADFSATPTQGCTPLTVKFSDLSNSAVSWNWDLGNGNTSTLQNPSAIFYNPGKYTIKLTIVDKSGKTFTITKSNIVRAFKSPKADFNVSPATICLGEKVAFTGTSTIGDTIITKYSWDMGDGNVLSVKSPVHTYAASGLYTVSMVVTDANGCQDKIQKIQIIKVNPKPVAQFKMDSAYDCKVPTFIPFKNNSIGNNLKYTWSFGDGTTSILTNPRHQYTKLGTYSPKLVVVDQNGCKDSITLSNALYLGPLIPDFISDKTVVCGSSMIEFENKTVFNGGLKYTWDFGDGTTSSNPYPSKFYKNVGKYSVTLTVQSVYRSCSASITKTNYIVVNPKPKGKIEINDSFPCSLPYVIVAKYVDTAKFTSIQWWLVENEKKWIKFGAKNPENFTINNKSKYKIVAYVVNQYGCLDSFNVDKIEVSKISATINGNFSGCVPLIFKGKANVVSNRKIMEIRWDFHDGDQYFTSNVVKTFNDTGVFRGSLTVTVEKNCTMKYDFKINVGQKVNPRFYTLPTGQICNNTNGIYFTNSTQYPGFTIDSFRWVFDDAEYRNTLLRVKPWSPLPKPYLKTNVWHYYDRDTGWLRPALIGYHHGCPDTVFQIDSIKIKAAFAKIILDYDICKKGSLIVRNKSSAYTNWEWYIDNIVYTSDTVVLNPSVYHHIILKVWDIQTGCWDTVSRDFFPMGPNLGIVDIINQQLCAPGSATLLAQHQGQSIYWKINGKDTALGKDEVTFKFDTAGVYEIETYMIYSKYCIKKVTNQFVVGESNLKGSIIPPKNCLPAEITLIDSSYKAGKKHAWVLSNGDTIRVKEFSTKFTIKNSFKDTIWARLISDGSLVICEPSLVVPIPVSGPGFRPRVLWQHTCSTSIFKGYLDKKRINETYTYNWDMGDGKIYNAQNVSHQYVDSGYYTIKISVTDQTGCTATETLKVYFPGQRLKVNVNYTTVGTKCPPLLVHFRDSSTCGNVSIVKWLWDFGDKSSSVLKNPSHQYVNPGKYSIRLTITDSLGCTATRLFLYLILVPGPDGKFSFSPKTGCLPLNVLFKDSVNSQTKNKEWDFGDGEVLQGNQFTHQYKKAGRYIPAMILEDSFGCRRSIKPSDTIVVYDLPQAKFVSTGLCLRDSVKFQSLSTCSDAGIKEIKWKLSPENKELNGAILSYKFAGKSNKIQLIVKSENQCSDTLIQPFNLFQPTAEVLNQTSVLCLGSSWLSNVKFQSDTTLAISTWTIDGKNIDSGRSSLNFVPTQSKVYQVQYFLKDKLGCWDTARQGINLKVGDTTIPLSPIWRRVSVVNDITHELVWKEYPTFDFKNYIVYQDKGSGFTEIQKLSNLKDTLYLVGGVDALRRSDCYKIGSTNLCNYTQDVTKLKNHCTIELKGSAGINLSKLNWSAYVGWPVERYVVYRQIDNGVFDSIGQVQGNVLSFVDTNIRCYKVHHYRVMAHEFNGLKEFSWSDTCHVTPQYWNKVKPPEMRRATVINDEYVRVEWQQLAKNKIPMERFVVVGKHGNNSSEYRWVINAHSDSLRITDKKIDVDLEYGVYKVLGIDECGDSSIFSKISKSILLDVNLNANFYPELKWTKYLDWKEGVKEYIVERRTDGEFIEIKRISNNDTSYIDELTNLNCLPKLEYRISAVRNSVYGLDSTWYYRSVSNIDDPGVVTKVFIPNAFTPNKNALNEVFKPQGIYIYKYSMKIFNRWGEKLYDVPEGCDHGWDGKFMGVEAPEGVYVYQVNVKGADGKIYPFFGDVTLLR